jgi:spermidine synthase
MRSKTRKSSIPSREKRVGVERGAPGPSTAAVIAVYLSFGLSGAAALGLQLVWTRRFSLGLGQETPALLGVLAAFFGGMSLGSWRFESVLVRSRFPGRWAAAMECVIGLWAWATVRLIPLADEWVRALGGAEPGPLWQGLLTFGIPFLFLLPATCAMGATLPALERFVSVQYGLSDRVGRLYASNTAGAVTGVLASVWLVQPRFGFEGATVLFGTLDLLIGMVLFFLARTPLPAGMDSSMGQGSDGCSSTQVSPAFRLLFLTGGFLGVALEVVVTRELSLALEGTVYTFAAVLSVFLVFTALGAGLSQFVRRSVGELACLLAVSWVGASYLLLLAPGWTNAWRNWFGSGLGPLFVLEASVATVILGLPTLLMGAIFARLIREARISALGIGPALSLNTLGGALASPCVGMLLLPVAGANRVCLGIALGYLALAALASSGFRLGKPPAGLLVSLGLVLGGGYFLPRQVEVAPPGRDVRLWKRFEGISDTISVWKYPDGNRSLSVNGRFTMGGTASTNAAARHLHIPLLLHPSPHRLLVLGLGTGISYAAAESHSQLTGDGIELVPEVVKAMAEFAPFNQLSDRFRVVVADARRFVRATTNRYDVIVADLYHPARDGAGTLYTVEHYQALRGRLSPGGLVCQWLPLYQLDETTLQSITAAFLSAFPDAQAWLLRPNVDTPVLGLIGRLSPTPFTPVDWTSRSEHPPLAAALKTTGLNDPFHFYGNWLAGAAALRSFSGSAPVNTDDHPTVVFDAPRFASSASNDPSRLLFALLDRFSGDSDEFSIDPGLPDAASWKRRCADYRLARDLYLRGLAADARHAESEAVAFYLSSVRQSVDFTSSYAQLIAMAMGRAGSRPAAAREILEQLGAARPERTLSRDLLRRLSRER